MLTVCVDIQTYTHVHSSLLCKLHVIPCMRVQKGASVRVHMSVLAHVPWGLAVDSLIPINPAI